MKEIETKSRLGIDQIVHADWSVNPKRRWQVRIERLDEQWLVHAPELVGDLSNFLERIEAGAPHGRSILGIDLPIGVPAFWARQARVDAFLPMLASLGAPPWEDFYNPAETSDQISPHRPFYPKRPGGTKQAHLLDALGARSMNDLRRRVDFSADTNRAASPLFWTIGAAQVGKAALTFWREVLQPGLISSNPPALWPFQGDLKGLTDQSTLTVCETYPAEVYEWFELGIRKSGKAKTNQDHRAEDAQAILDAGAMLGAAFTPEAAANINDGFEMGDDAFDAMVGALGMLQVVRGQRAPGTPDDLTVRQLEGWILGRRAGATSPP
jgi:hypothetical protein